MILILCGSAAFAQTGDGPRAVRVDEIGTATNGYVKMTMDSFYDELNNNPAAEGLIINYGTDREIAVRERQIQMSINFRKFDPSRITIVRGGWREKAGSELWLVPPGAERPRPETTAEKLDEFLKVPDGDLKARIDNFYNSLANKPNSKGYILLSGPPRLSASRKALITRYIRLRKLDLALVTFKDSGIKNTERTEFWIQPAADKKSSKTEIWIVPPGAKTPSPR